MVSYKWFALVSFRDDVIPFASLDNLYRCLLSGESKVVTIVTQVCGYFAIETINYTEPWTLDVHNDFNTAAWV